MRGLTMIVAGADPARLHAAFSVAAANAALDRKTRIFLQGDAVALLRLKAGPDDDRYSMAGIPTLRQLLEESLALGVAVTACQSGLALEGMTATDLPDGITTGGLIEILTSAGDDQLLMA